MRKQLVVSAVATAVMMTLGTSTAFAGEITGQGDRKPVNGNSPCAFSGQEDLQWFTTDGDTTPVADPVRGVPAHSQNWGHARKALGLSGGANSVPEIGWGCNGHTYGLK
jgi:hypothetical protein